MKNRFIGLIVGAFATALPAMAHHSFAIYDMDQDIHFALTLRVTKDDGTTATIEFIEGAPANMLVRMGLDPADIAAGKPIRAVGAPLRNDPNAYFLKAILLPNGRRYTFVD
jgi:hypothetical protein